MATERKCPRCGAGLSGSTLQGLCPKCVARLAMADALGDPPPHTPAGDTPHPADPTKVRYFGDYELIEEIAHGGMGVVWQARQDSLNRLVALKMIRTGELATPAEVQRFHAEAEAAASLDHPNIVPIYEVGEHDGRQYFSMKLIEGANLAQHLARTARSSRGEQASTDASPETPDPGPTSEPPHVVCYDLKEIARLMAKVARAVHYAHQRGIIHRDLKPGNILLDENGEPHVTDFGLAKRLELDSDLTHSGTVVGTPHYMSPEQATGQTRNLTTGADIYSLGAILYHLLTGRPPFKAETPLEVLRLVTEREPDRPSTLNPRVDRDLETICLKCLEKDPERRYASANGVANDLDRWLNREPILARPSSTSEHVHKWLQRRPPIFFAMATAVVVCLLGGLGGVVWQWQQTQAARRATAEETVEKAKAQVQRVKAEQETEVAAQQHALERSRKEDAEVRLELDRVNRWFREDEPAYALAYLARVGRQYPSHAMVAERLVTEVCKRKFARELVDPVEDVLSGYWLAISQDDRWALALKSPSRLALLDLSTGQEMNSWPTFNSPQHQPNAILSSDGSRAAITSGTDVHVWDTAKDFATALTLPHTHPVRLLHFNTNATRLITDSGRDWVVWEIPSGRLVQRISEEGMPTARSFLINRLSALAVPVPNGNETILRFRDLETGKLFREIALLHRIGPEYRSPVVSLDLTRMAVAFTNGKVCVHDYTNPEGRILYELDHPGVKDMEFSPDGAFLMSQGDSDLRLWSTSKGEPWKSTLRFESGLNSARFSPEGLRIVTTSEGKAQIWSTITLQPVCLPIEHWQALSDAWFSDDGRKLLTWTEDRTLHVWDARVGEMAEKVAETPRTQLRASGFRATTIGPKPSRRILPPLPVVQDRPWRDEVLPLPIPSVLPRALEAAVGLRLNDRGEGTPVPLEETKVIQLELAAHARTNLYERVATWLLSDPTARTASPFSTDARREVDARVDRKNIENFCTALWLEPTNALASARMALEFSLSSWSPDETLRDTVFVNFHLARAEKHGGQVHEVWAIRAELASQQGAINSAIRIVEEACIRFPDDVTFWELKANLLARYLRPAEALEALNEAFKLARGSQAATVLQTRNFLLARSRLFHTLGRAAEADMDENEAFRTMDIKGDWPAWGGSDSGRNLNSRTEGLPERFDPGRLIRGSERIDITTTRNVRWVAKLGSQCYPSPVVSGGKVFIGTNNGAPRDTRHQGDRSILLCLDERTGFLLWQLVVPKLKSGKVNDWDDLGITTTPTVVGNRLYIVTSRAEVLCLDVEGMVNGNDGPFTDEANYVVQDVLGPDDKPAEPIPPTLRDADIIWRYDMINELGVFPHNASACSVLVIGDIVYVNTGNGQDSTHQNVPSPHSPSVIALDRHTGKLLGQDSEDIGTRIFHAQWNSPSGGKINGLQQIFFGGGDGWLYAFDGKPKNEGGTNILKTVWKVDCNPPEYKIKNGVPIKYPQAEGPSEVFATPVFYKNRIYVAIGQDPEHGEGVGNLLCIDATKTGDVTKTGVIWSYRGIRRSLSTVAIDPENGLLFTADFSGFIHCLDADTGRLYWKHDSKAHIWGSPVVADGKVFIGTEDGAFMILASSLHKTLLSQTDLGAPIYSTPTAAGGVLYVASQSHLYAVQDLRLGTAKR